MGVNRYQNIQGRVSKQQIVLCLVVHTLCKVLIRGCNNLILKFNQTKWVSVLAHFIPCNRSNIYLFIFAHSLPNFSAALIPYRVICQTVDNCLPGSFRYRFKKILPKQMYQKN